MPFFLRSITGRLVFWFFCCTAILLTAAGAVLDHEVGKIVFSSVDRTLHSKLQIITGLLHEEHGTVELELSEIIAGEYVIPRSGHYYRIMRDKRILAASPSLVHADFDFVPARSESDNQFPGETIYTSIGPDDEPVRVLRYRHAAFNATFDITLAENLREGLGMIATYQGFLLGIIPLGIVILCLTAWWIARVSLRPIAAFSSTIAAISHKNLTDRTDAGRMVQELTALASSFNGMLDRLHTVFESQKRLIADASHELKTPLSVIKTQCDVVLQRTRTTGEYIDALKAIQASTEDMARLVLDLLSLARIDAGLIDASDFTSLSLKECLDKAIAMTGQLVSSRKVNIMLTDLAAITVMGSRIGIVEAFLNIIDNGVRYNREGGSVTITAKTVGGNAVVAIADTGMGIASGDLPKIFGRFYRASAVRNTEGTGLGLSIAQSVIAAHGGEIRVESEPGAGSRFTILLPLGGLEQKGKKSLLRKAS
ncbi:MAG: hypothetical protein A2521_06055 [Deltaproteobacteria bacterium RIFOXYD12_FULL_57_12]|nr:MAG: hypothetical protein A2521_06055 [Deltaproteobacteria bacterium RIFOXYD12_FULL_57_12]